MYEKYLSAKKRYNYYGYAAPGANCGDHFPDKVYDKATDTRTLDAYVDYKNVGFNTLFTGTTATYFGEEWETSMTKRVLDTAYEAGLEKVIISVEKIYWLSREKDGIIGPGKRFANENELDGFLADLLKDCFKHPAFYGLNLCDEPFSYMFKSFGQLYRSLKRIKPDIFIQCNLLPLDTLVWMDERYPQGGTLFERRRKYLQSFIDETGADYVMYDDYPFSYAKENKRLYLYCLQDSACFCRDKGLNFQFVAQSFSMNIGKNPYYYVPSEQEMAFQLNLLVSFGVEDLGFFTYMPHGAGGDEHFPDDSAIVDRQCKKRDFYYVCQKVIREIKPIHAVLSHFKFKRTAYAVKTFKAYNRWFDFALNEKLDNVVSLETDSENVIVNELYNEDDDRYMYAVINSTDTREDATKDLIQNTVIGFDGKYKFADIYKNGKWETVGITDGKLTATLRSGESEYIIVY